MTDFDSLVDDFKAAVDQELADRSAATAAAQAKADAAAAQVVDLQRQVASLTDHVAALEAALAAAKVKPLLGYYVGGTAYDATGTALFGTAPQISSTYYQPVQPGLNVTAEKARIAKGIVPLITLTSKGTQYLVDIAAGNTAGPGWAWLQSYVKALATLGAAAKAAGLPLYATLDHEWEVKVNQGLLTGQAADPKVYAAALSRFIDLVHKQAPGVTVLHWFGGSDKTKIAAVAAAMTAKPDAYSYDPYSSTSHSTTETLESLATPTLTWIKAQPWYAGQPIGLSEFGANHADAQMAAFYTGIRPTLAKLGLVFGVLFSRDDGIYSKTLTISATPASVAAVAASLKG